MKDDENYVPPLAKPSASKQSTQEEAARFLQAEIIKLEAKTKQLEGDKAALVQEYILASDEEAPEKVKKNIRARMPKALEVLDELLASGSDGVKSGLVKWIIDRGLSPEQLGGDPASKELQKLLKGLASND